MLERLKQKWNIKNNTQLVVILILFSITGSSTIVIKNGAFYLLGITSETDLWLRSLVYFLIVFPAYNLMLLVFGFLLGQFRFALEFEKKMLSRLKWKSK